MAVFGFARLIVVRRVGTSTPITKNNHKQARRPRPNGGDAVSDGLTAIVPWNPVMSKTDALIMQPRVDQIFRVVQASASEDALYSAATGNSTFSLTTTLAAQAAANSSALVALFDQYKIEMVEVLISPQQNVSSGPGTEYVTPPVLYTVLDFDDATSLASETAATGYASMIRTECFEKQRRCYRPRIAYAAYSGAFTSYANQKAGWIDCNSASVIHYGVKALITPDGNASGGQRCLWDLVVRVQFAFRSTH